MAPFLDHHLLVLVARFRALAACPPDGRVTRPPAVGDCFEVLLHLVQVLQQNKLETARLVPQGKTRKHVNDVILKESM